MMEPKERDHTLGNTVCRLLFILLFTTLVVHPAKADSGAIVIPSGTILPVRLNSTISSATCKSGQVITGRIMQNVLLASGGRIREGSKIIGHIVEVTPATTGVQARISLQFDKLVFSNQNVSIVTNLRAIAGFMQIIEAQTPPIGPGEGDVYRWLTTVQVGGTLYTVKVALSPVPIIRIKSWEKP
jgi:hypothetical protein